MIHLDAAACSRPSDEVLAAQVRHLEFEREVGAYVAEEQVTPLIDGARRRICELLAAEAEVAFTDGALRAFASAVAFLRPRQVALLPSEYAENVDVLRTLRCHITLLDYDEVGRLRLESLQAVLRTGVDCVVLDHVASQHGIVQPVRQAADLCRAAGVPLIVDVAQSLGHIDCTDLAATYYVGNSRKWLHGPRGVGFLAGPDARRLELGESSAAARIGFATAVEEIVSRPPFKRLAELGRYARAKFDGVGGWRVTEPLTEPTALVTLRPPAGLDPFETKQRLYQRGFLVAALEVGRSADLTAPLLRVSPDVNVREEDLDQLAETLPAAAERR